MSPPLPHHHQLDPRLIELIRRTREGMAGYEGDLVLAGGLVQFFYPCHPQFLNPLMHPRATRDLDLAVPPQLPDRDRSLKAGLLESGLTEILDRGDDRTGMPSASFFQRREEGGARRSDVYLEFITPRRGSGLAVAIEPQPGLYAQSLRYVDLLLYKPMTLAIPEVGSLQVPNPISFIIQKTLIDRPLRDSPVKDAADAFYVAVGFERLWPAFSCHWQEMSRVSAEWKPWLARANRRWHSWMDPRTSTMTRDIAGFFQDTATITITPEMVADILKRFMAAVVPPME